MAYFEAFAQFDLNNIDLNWYDANAEDSGLDNNSYVEINGRVYEDLFFVDGYDGSNWLELVFLGSGISQDFTGDVVAGTVNFVGEIDLFTDSLLWYVEGFSASAVSIYRAALTASNQDEIAIIAAALNGDDTIVLSDDSDRMYGFNGDDEMFGLDGNDTLDGGKGNDSITGGGGNDTIDGGEGNDEAWYDDATAGVIVDLSAGTARSLVGDAALVGSDRLISIENVTGSVFADSLLGDALGNVLDGNAGDDVITGAGGADRLFGYNGDDQLLGGDGSDQLWGEKGNDILDGGSGADVMYGGAGDDTYVVDHASDLAYEAAGEGVDTVTSSVTYYLRDNVENLTLTGSAALVGRGNAGVNEIIGNSGGNRIDGRGGNDTLIGNGGNDRLDGGTGSDALIGGTGNDNYVIDSLGDRIVERSGEGTDFVYTYVDWTLGANLERLYMFGDAAIDASGNELANLLVGNDSANSLAGLLGNDRLYGKAGSDTLNGGDGNDYLEGGAGQDTLMGGAGRDYFAFREGDFGGATTATADRIMDFTTGDRIQLQAIDADTTVAGNQAFSFLGTGAFSGTAGQLRTEQISGNTYVSGDTNGDGVADFMIRLDGLHTVGTTDLLL